MPLASLVPLHTHTNLFLSVVYDDQICSCVCTVSSALSPALRLRLMALPSTYKRNQISHELNFDPHQAKKVMLVVVLLYILLYLFTRVCLYLY